MMLMIICLCIIYWNKYLLERLLLLFHPPPPCSQRWLYNILVHEKLRFLFSFKRTKPHRLPFQFQGMWHWVFAEASIYYSLLERSWTCLESLARAAVSPQSTPRHIRRSLSVYSPFKSVLGRLLPLCLLQAYKKPNELSSSLEVPLTKQCSHYY